MFVPDEPVSSVKDDKLGRANFARKLAQVLHEWEQEESIVVGLYGSWGSGKTSLVNMILEQIKFFSSSENQPAIPNLIRVSSIRATIRKLSFSKATNPEVEISENPESPIIIYFNPWYFSNTDELLQAFFTQVFTVISSRSERFKESLRQTLKKYGSAIEKATEKVPVLGGVTSGLNIAISGESLSDTRERLNQAFRDLGRKVIIVIDDLDRLRQAEIRQMLQLVKLNANFPNTIYLLAADREVIEKSLKIEQGISGRDYLEKIVQAGFDIPPIDSSYISGLLTEEINRALTGYEGPIDSRRWADIYQGGFRNFFVTLRDVKRFVNSLSFNYLLVSSEINIEDFISLEALRVFAPEVYETIAENKRLFTSFWAWGKRDELRPLFDEIFAQGSSYADICRNIAIALFPQINFVYYNTAYPPEYLSLWRKEKRICVPENFDAYFLLGVPVGEISQAELAQLKVEAQDYAHLKTTFQNIIESGRFRRLLERLVNILDELETASAQNLCALLLELGDELPDESKGFFDPGSDFLLAGIVYQLLDRIDENTRCQWMTEKILNGTSLYTPLRLVAVNEHYHSEGRVDETIFNEECLQELKQASVNRIESEARTRVLTRVKNLDFILLTWQDWTTNQENLDDFIHYMTETPDRIAELLTLFLTQEYFPPPIHGIRPQIKRADLSRIVDLDELQQRLASFLEEGFNPQSLSEIQQVAVNTFLQPPQLSQERSLN